MPPVLLHSSSATLASLIAIHPFFLVNPLLGNGNTSHPAQWNTLSVLCICIYTTQCQSHRTILVFHVYFLFSRWKYIWLYISALVIRDQKMYKSNNTFNDISSLVKEYVISQFGQLSQSFNSLIVIIFNRSLISTI